MNDAIRMMREEHRSISAVLSGMRELARQAREPGMPPRLDVLRAMVYYVDAFPERLHHPKEERYLFAKLAERSPAARKLVEDLRAEHETGARRVRDLEQALLRLEHTWPRGADQFAAEVERFARFHWDHMWREEHELLPLAEAALTAADWAELSAALAANEDPIAELRHAEFSRLYMRIVDIAPEIPTGRFAEVM